MHNDSIKLKRYYDTILIFFLMLVVAGSLSLKLVDDRAISRDRQEQKVACERARKITDTALHLIESNSRVIKTSLTYAVQARKRDSDILGVKAYSKALSASESALEVVAQTIMLNDEFLCPFHK